METLGMLIVFLGELMTSAPVVCLTVAGGKNPWMNTSANVFFSGLPVLLFGLAIAHYGRRLRLAKN